MRGSSLVGGFSGGDAHGDPHGERGAGEVADNSMLSPWWDI